MKTAVHCKTLLVVVACLLSTQGSAAQQDDAGTRGSRAAKNRQREGEHTGRYSHGYGMSREHIMEHHETRKGHLQQMIDDVRQRLEDHSSGEKPFASTEEHERHLHRMKVYTRKMEQMKEPPGEQEINRILEREARRNQLLDAEL